MKKISVSIGIVLLATLSSCKKDSPRKVENMLEEGTWKITLFSEDGEDYTVGYEGDTFTFNANGTVDVTHASTSFSGTWATSKDDDHTELVLTFTNPAELQELSDDWDLIEKTDTSIKLHDESSDGSHDYLTFEKI